MPTVSANVSTVIIFLVYGRILHKKREKMFTKIKAIPSRKKPYCLVEKFVTGMYYKNKLKI